MNVITQQGDTLDLLCLRYYSYTQGVVETVLAANPGLADLGVILPYGTPVNLPEAQAPTQTETVNLWA